MNKALIVVTAAVILTAVSPVRAQDISEGQVIAFDRVANVIVLKDKTVWPLEKLTGSMPEGLEAGDRIEIKYDFNEDDGVTRIYSIEVLPAQS